jgi:hypothetical protein
MSTLERAGEALHEGDRLNASARPGPASLAYQRASALALLAVAEAIARRVEEIKPSAGKK